MGTAGSTIRRVSILVAWIAAVAGGYLMLIDYSSRPGAAASIAPDWPGASPLALQNSGPTLVVFLHPHCPCSLATLSMLERILSGSPSLPAHLVLFVPQSASDGWQRGELYLRARALPDARIHLDRGGDIARRFGARTSGDCAVYSSRGERLFAGGITAGRGHEGDNPGSRAVAAILRGEPCVTRETPAFGCSLGDCDGDTPIAGVLDPERTNR